MNYTRKWAEIDPSGTYRWLLGRQWGSGPFCHFTMLNPSSADAMEDDPTIRRCVGYALREDCGGLLVTNLSSFRATKPQQLLAWLKSCERAGRLDERWGSETDQYILECALGSKFNIVAWGGNARHKLLQHRAKVVLEQLLINAQAGVSAIEVLDDGVPSHPLMLPGSLRPAPFPKVAA